MNKSEPAAVKCGDPCPMASGRRIGRAVPMVAGEHDRIGRWMTRTGRGIGGPGSAVRRGYAGAGSYSMGICRAPGRGCDYGASERSGARRPGGSARGGVHCRAVGGEYGSEAARRQCA